MSADALLNLLENVRSTGKNTWSARCPAHSDRSNSLSIAQPDEKVLVHCFAGCSVHEVVGAVGLEITDLFPPRQHYGKPERRPFPAADALRACAYELLFGATVFATIRAGGTLTEADGDRLILAASRLNSAVNAVAPGLRAHRHG